MNKSKFDLANLYQEVTNASATLRFLICNDCGWSEATFYRKMRTNSYSEAEVDSIKKNTESLLDKIKLDVNNNGRAREADTRLEEFKNTAETYDELDKINDTKIDENSVSKEITELGEA
ncbi:hypothetical protein [Chitinophaga niabensis]|uniref:Uncharacterized protein n=1 Tax=Chitinophaga niabensis TaxID=536979 RepID=A0A1N6KB00_9BACT|nr:hypothetical protein [Chitinophaga niabensis]SIO53711.1 hypothetical protein SAMN04488055_5465 [Chitinophaga niabensis]